MARPTTGARHDLTLQLFELFRGRGYDGLSIGDISAATGLGKSSLYHHFPGGKEEMAEAVVAFADIAIADLVLKTLSGPGTPAERIGAMLDGALKLYAAKPCVLASLLSGADAHAAFGVKLREVFERWREAIAAAVAETGADSKTSHERASVALALIQGGLVMARAMEDPGQFETAVRAARRMLAEPSV